jgi:tRNA U34 5-carboxymethylaminomethyl modifying enzyme MnmG/GidA
MPILADAHDCRSCDTCVSQEGHHYCLLHTFQIKNMDTVRCSDWTQRPNDEARAAQRIPNERNGMTKERIKEIRDFFYKPQFTTSSFAKECLDEIERLQDELSQSIPSRYERDQVKALTAEVARLKAAFGPTIEMLKRVDGKGPFEFLHPEISASVKQELARLRAILEKGTE